MSVKQSFAAFFAFVTWLFVGCAAMAAPYAALVMDARTGEVLHSRNADTRLHPASLTKMMTLYVVFEAIEHGEISLDTMVTIPAQAAAEPPSKLGLRSGQRIRLRYLIRAAAVKSANDAATALAFAIEGSESAFAERMNRTARALGMTRTNFRNAHGLTQDGHMSTARDMSTLGRHLFYDYPEYYNLFSRITADAGVREVSNTNRRFLTAYRGADGIKTGYTRAAGFNLVASAERGGKRIIATMFGGTSTAQRNARVAQLLDMGFSRAPSRVRERRPSRPRYQGPIRRGGSSSAVASTSGVSAGPAATTIRLSGAVSRALRPRARPVPTAPSPEVVASADAITAAVTAALAAPVAPETAPASASETAPAPDPNAASAATLASVTLPRARPATLSATRVIPPIPTPRAPAEPETVTLASSAGPRSWGINVGRYTTKYQAERVLLKVALNELETLEGSTRAVASSSVGHDATFTSLTRDQADLACRRLQAKGTTCFMMAP